MNLKATVLVLAVTAGMAVFGETNSIPWRLPAYSLNARDMSVRDVFETFGVAQGIPVSMSDQVAGQVSGSFSEMPAVEFMDRIATVNNLSWYYDGAQLYVYGASETQTTLIDLKYMKAGEVSAMLGELGIEDARFPIRTARNDELIMVSGPPRYVQLVSEMIGRADRIREQRTFNEVEVRLFPLKYTWADNVTFSVTTSESTVPIQGIAQILEEMTKQDPGDRSREGTNDVSRSELQRDMMGLSFKPTIKPENRVNAIMVRDVATRMPMYERLIRELDRPTKLLEIAITTLELSKEDAFEWQLSVSANGHATARNGRDVHDAAAGSNVDNQMSVDKLLGKGLAGAYSFATDNLNVSASLAALKSSGKTRSISRTSLLTMNNLAAQITDDQTYNARVVGERVASIQSVTAGTTFRIKPRAIKPAGTNLLHTMWMSLEIQDGGFESTKVDGMPMTRKTSLTTQTVMQEGQSLILAGYMRDVEGESGWGIPLLRDIPWIGWLFGGETRTTETVQRFFILTPRVIEGVGPETPLEQVDFQRNVKDIDAVEDRSESVDDDRRLRKLERKNAREIIEQKRDVKYERREAEVEAERRARELEKRGKDDELERDVRLWKLQDRLSERQYEQKKAVEDKAAERREDEITDRIDEAARKAEEAKD